MAINLQKGQRISLEKEAGGRLSKVVMGLGWDAVKKKRFFRQNKKSGHRPGCNRAIV
jgi:tellurium resistance protein TerZ